MVSMSYTTTVMFESCFCAAHMQWHNRSVGSNFSLVRRRALLSDEIVAAQWRAQRADQEMEQAREARHMGVSGGPPPGKF